MFGSTPDRPAIALLKGVILPIAILPASALGFVMRPTPIWLGVAVLGLVVAALGIRRLMSRSHWFQV